MATILSSPVPRAARPWVGPLAALVLASIAFAPAGCGRTRSGGVPVEPPKPDLRQERPAEVRVGVPRDRVVVDDGDTIDIEWGSSDTETVRILGIDTPETQHVEHNIPFDQPFGREARAFAKGAFAMADSIEILRARMKDPFGRTLGYVFLDGRNYSELVLRAGLAVESVSRFGDNGFPEEARLMREAARAGEPVPFEDPAEYRKRMRRVSEAQK